MPAPVKDQKFHLLFDWFDQGGDGVLSQDDLQAMGTLFAALDTADDQANAQAMRDAFEHWWQLLRTHADTDGDGRVSRAEFLAAMADNVTAPEHFERAVLAIADALMRALDTNGDGQLSHAEYVRMYSALGVPPKHSNDAFRRLDRDGSGEISHAEFRQAITEFYLSNDANAPGNWLIGPIAPAA